MEDPFGHAEHVAGRLADPGRHAPQLRGAQVLGAAAGDDGETLEPVEHDLRRSLVDGRLKDRREALLGLVQPPEPGQRESVVRGREQTRPAGGGLGELAQAPLGGLEVLGDDLRVAAVAEDRVQRRRYCRAPGRVRSARSEYAASAATSPRPSAAIERAMSAIASGARSSSRSNTACASGGELLATVVVALPPSDAASAASNARARSPSSAPSDRASTSSQPAEPLGQVAAARPVEEPAGRRQAQLE